VAVSRLVKIFGFEHLQGDGCRFMLNQHGAEYGFFNFDRLGRNASAIVRCRAVLLVLISGAVRVSHMLLKQILLTINVEPGGNCHTIMPGLTNYKKVQDICTLKSE
jgi:hypothetical protein